MLSNLVRKLLSSLDSQRIILLQFHSNDSTFFVVDEMINENMCTDVT